MTEDYYDNVRRRLIAGIDALITECWSRKRENDDLWALDVTKERQIVVAERDMLYDAIYERLNVEDWTNPEKGITKMQAHLDALTRLDAKSQAPDTDEHWWPAPGPHSIWCDGRCGKGGFSSNPGDYCAAARSELGSPGPSERGQDGRDLSKYSLRELKDAVFDQALGGHHDQELYDEISRREEEADNEWDGPAVVVCTKCRDGKWFETDWREYPCLYLGDHICVVVIRPSADG